MQNKNTTSTSALAARLAIQKQYNATLHADLSMPVAGYSRQLSKQIAEYAEVDAGVSSILRDIIYIALQTERHKQGKEIGKYMAAQATILPIVFEAPESKEAESIALEVLKAAQVIETQTSQTFQSAAQEPAGHEISGVIDLNALALVSTRRANSLRQKIKSISDGSFWSRPEPIIWFCLQCGFTVKSATAFENCPCCQAGREYASA